jgi:hypothetical protein
MPPKLKTVHIFKVTLQEGRCEPLKPKPSRTLAIRSNDTLYDLAEAIIPAFGFDLDHCFGFYNNLRNYMNSTESYSLFTDMDDCEDDGGSVEQTEIKDVFTLKKKMVFLFDYGDDWIFHITCTAIQDAEKGKRYPHILKSVGDAPEQYPVFDE